MLIVAWKISSCTELILIGQFLFTAFYGHVIAGFKLLSQAFFSQTFYSWCKTFFHWNCSPTDFMPSFSGFVITGMLLLAPSLLSLVLLSQTCYCWCQSFFLWTCYHRHVIANFKPSFSWLVPTDIWLLTSISPLRHVEVTQDTSRMLYISFSF